MVKLKYIVLDQCHIIVFDQGLIHKNVAQGTRKACGRGTHLEVTGAGFVRFDGKGKGRCYGLSESLDICCDDVIDNNLLESQFGVEIIRH